ncbi:GNAT family N-acetyltransferase [Flindersiella endophytica]
MRLYELPVRFHDVRLPADASIVSAADVSAEALMDLDCRLRDDVPRSEGWFREENHDSPYFDPRGYLVARAGGRDVGLVRIWNGPRPLPRLGLIAILPAYRRRGIARALLAQAINTWHERGGATITAEDDAGNRVSIALLTAFGGHVTGGTIELAR